MSAERRDEGPAGEAAVVRVEGLVHRYARRGLEDHPVLGGLDLEVRGGELLAVVGPSGGGKTTLLHLVAGLIVPTAGRVVLAPEARPAMVFQRPRLMPWRTAVENAAFGLECLGAAAPLPKAAALLGELGLADAVHAWPRELSEGMRQRVNLARALLVQPDVLLLDEPFAALDALTRRRLHRDLLALLRDRPRLAVVLVSHDLDEVAALADRALVLSDRPAVVRADLPIALPHPRDADAAGRLELAGRREELERLLGSPEGAAPE